MTTADPTELREAATHLAATDLFSLLEPAELAALAARASATRYPAGQVITRDGDIDATLWVIANGSVSIDRKDSGVTVDRISFGGYGTVVGELGVFAGQPRRGDVVTAEPTMLLHIEREDLWATLVERDLLDRLVLTDRVRARLAEAHPPAASAGEHQVGVYRRHWLVLLRGLIVPSIALVVALFLGLALSTLTSFLDEAAPLAVLVLALLGLGLPLAGFLWAFLDYYQDCLIVTNKRVIYIERTPLIDARRAEARLGRVQDVAVVIPNVMARLFGYGDITVQTAASHGAIRFRAVPWPEHVRQTIFSQADRARDEERRERQSWIDEQVRLAIGGTPATETVETREDLGDLQQQGSPMLRAIGAWLLRAMGYFWPKMRVQDGSVTTWRKHWWVLVRSSAVPLAILFVTNLLVIALMWQGQAPPWLVVAVVWAVLDAWLLWRYENWRNDLYQLTDEHIVDIERLPLGMFGERRQASLSQVQDVRYVVPNPLATVLNWGHVVIQTAAETGEFTFDYVFHPAAVHEEIVARIDECRARQHQTEEEQRAREWARWLASYHRLSGHTGAGEAPGSASAREPDSRSERVSPSEPDDPTRPAPHGDPPSTPESAEGRIAPSL